jgi:hypothetical protein
VGLGNHVLGNMIYGEISGGFDIVVSVSGHYIRAQDKSQQSRTAAQMGYTGKNSHIRNSVWRFGSDEVGRFITGTTVN